MTLGLLEIAPPGRCWTCDAPTRGWMTLCPWCGEDVRGPEVAGRGSAAGAQAVPGLGSLTVIDGTGGRAPAGVDRRREPLGRSASDIEVPALSSAAGGGQVDVIHGDEAIEIQPRPLHPEPATTAAPAASHTPVEPVPDPVIPLRSATATSIGSLAAAEVAPASPGLEPEPRNVILASAVYVTGTRGLQAGSRYGIALVGDDVHILGPVDVDPTAVTLVSSLRGLDATGHQGRLIITAGQSQRNRLALVFMSLAGGSADDVADAIVAAASDLIADRR